MTNNIKKRVTTEIDGRICEILQKKYRLTDEKQKYKNVRRN